MELLPDPVSVTPLAADATNEQADLIDQSLTGKLSVTNNPPTVIIQSGALSSDGYDVLISVCNSPVSFHKVFHDGFFFIIDYFY